ncbi:hypothetical protein TELCIR_18140, partial [Teladorsagia circumcincta]
MCALRRDSAVTEEELDEHQIGQLYESQLVQLEKLIAVQRRSHLRAKSLLAAAEKRHFKALRELELEKERKSRYAAQGDDVLALLEREREKLCQQAENLSLKEVVKGQEADLLMLRKNLISSTKLTFDKPATLRKAAYLVLLLRQQGDSPHRGEFFIIICACRAGTRQHVYWHLLRMPSSPSKKTPAMGLGTTRRVPPPPRYAEPELQELEAAIESMAATN